MYSSNNTLVLLKQHTYPWIPSESVWGQSLLVVVYGQHAPLASNACNIYLQIKQRESIYRSNPQENEELNKNV